MHACRCIAFSIALVHFFFVTTPVASQLMHSEGTRGLVIALSEKNPKNQPIDIFAAKKSRLKYTSNKNEEDFYFGDLDTREIDKEIINFISKSDILKKKELVFFFQRPLITDVQIDIIVDRIIKTINDAGRHRVVDSRSIETIFSAQKLSKNNLQYDDFLKNIKYDLVINCYQNEINLNQKLFCEILNVENNVMIAKKEFNSEKNTLSMSVDSIHSEFAKMAKNFTDIRARDLDIYIQPREFRAGEKTALSVFLEGKIQSSFREYKRLLGNDNVILTGRNGANEPGNNKIYRDIKIRGTLYRSADDEAFLILSNDLNSSQKGDSTFVLSLNGLPDILRKSSPSINGSLVWNGFSDKKQFVNNDDAYWASVKAARYLALTGKGPAFPGDKYSYKQAMELFRGGFSSGFFLDEHIGRMGEGASNKIGVSLTGQIWRFKKIQDGNIKLKMSKKVYLENEPMRLVFESEVPVFLGIFAITFDERVVRIYPRERKNLLNITPVRKLKIPDDDRFELISMPRPHMGKVTDYEAILVIGSRSFVDFSRIGPLVAELIPGREAPSGSLTEVLGVIKRASAGDLYVSVLPYGVKR